MAYAVKTPWWLKRLYGRCLWQVPATENVLYLTFDDGPHPEATPFVLDQLRIYGAKATFFCIGKNVVAHPGLYGQLIEEGHRVGNHTQHHVNGWKTAMEAYLEEVKEAGKWIQSDLFRPPYGKISFSQARKIRQELGLKVVMWSVLSGDFDVEISGARCAENVLNHAQAGSIVVFHDSQKAWERLQVALPATLKYFAERGFRFEIL